MPIKGSTILTGATVSASGGTSSTLTLTGAEVKHGLQVADMSVTDFRVRPFANFKQKQPAIVNNVYSKARNEIMAVFPKLCADGIVRFPLIRFICEPHPEQTDAEVVKMLTWGAQFGFDSDFASFLKYGSMD